MKNPYEGFPVLLKRDRMDRRNNALIWAAIIITLCIAVYALAG